MSLTADALQPRLVRTLIELSGRVEICHLSDVVIGGAGFDLEFDATARAIQMDFRDRNYLGHKIAGDAGRFSSAAFISMHEMDAHLEESVSVAWSLIRLYYAAFYSGHCIIRLLGESCSYLDSTHVTKIRELGAAASNPAPFPVIAGAYHMTLNAAQTGMGMVKAGTRAAGAHEVFWGILDNFLATTGSATMLGHLTPDDGRAVFSKIEAFRDITRRGAGASWLSAVRNEIQYRHDRGVWTPATVNKTGRALLGRLSQQWKRDPMDIDLELPPGGELGRFVAASAFLVALCKAVIKRIAERSSAGKRSFARVLLQLC